jgi:hypothetical protein
MYGLRDRVIGHVTRHIRSWMPRSGLRAGSNSPGCEGRCLGCAPFGLIILPGYPPEEFGRHFLIFQLLYGCIEVRKILIIKGLRLKYSF